MWGSEDMMNNKKDRDEELNELKKEIEKIVGKEEVERIKNIVELSYKFDERPQYKITYSIVGGRGNHAIEE